MDQAKIGCFIAQCRKRANLTQMQLAEMLDITDRAVSKWETGKSMPDTSIMLDLCRILNISVNDLLNGEVVQMDNYNEKQEQLLLELAKQKEAADKRLLSIELFVGVLLVIIMLALAVFVSVVPMAEWLKITLILIGLIPLLIAVPFMIRIEQTAGYYECAKCAHRYVPTFSNVLWAMHVHTTRYMRCPHCGRKSWQKKVLRKE